jgi:2-oxoglutarate ferredoxin oxidoreductase subunit delta
MKGKILIDSQTCKGCKYCVLACPKGVITIEEKLNTNGFFPAAAVHMNECTGCAMCAEVCPEIAIEVWKGK